MIHKYFKKKLFISLVMLIVFISIQANPSWYQNPQRFYNPEHFFVGIGEGISLDDAFSEARQDLSNQVSLTINTETDISFLSNEAESQGYYLESLNQNIRKISEQQTENSEIMRQEQLSEQFYVMVSLNKTRMFTNLEIEMNEILNKIQINLDSIRLLTEHGQLVSVMDTYSVIHNDLIDFYSLKMLYDHFAQSPFTVQHLITGNDIENRVRGLIASIRFEVLQGNHQTAKQGTILPEAIIFNASSRIPNGDRVNIDNLPVSIQYGDGRLIDAGFTNEKGTYTVYAIAVPEQADRGRIIIQINPVRFPIFYTRNMMHVYGSAHFRLTEAIPLNIKLSIINENGEVIENTQRQLSRILTNNNIIPNDDSSLFMNGVVSIKETRVVDGFGTSRHLVDAEIDIIFGVVDSGAVFGNIQGSGRGLSELNENDAIDRAYSNISINTRDLNQLINSAENHLAFVIEAESREYLDRGIRFYEAGNHRAATEALLQVNFGESYIQEALEILMNMRN